MNCSKEIVVALCLFFLSGSAKCYFKMFSGNTKPYPIYVDDIHRKMYSGCLCHFATKQMGYVAFLNKNDYRRQSKMPAKCFLGCSQNIFVEPPDGEVVGLFSQKTSSSRAGTSDSRNKPIKFQFFNNY